MNKTNAMRIIERDGAEYTVHTYDGGALSGVAVAEELGEDVSRVYKTLVTTSGSGKFFVSLTSKKLQRRRGKSLWRCCRRNSFCPSPAIFTAVVRPSE